ncbi:hypothetical protein Tco_1415260 [Tanacetum coccineum]
MLFIKRSDAALVCHSKPLDSVKNWNDHFFWVDSTAFPLSVSLKSKILKMDLFAFICHSDPTKVRIREKGPAEREVKLLTLTKGHTVLFNPPASAASWDSDDSIDKLFDEGVMLDDNLNFLCFDCNLDCIGFDYFAHMVEQNLVVKFG